MTRFAFRLAFLVLVLAAGAPAEDAATRAERFNGLIESLNAPSERRTRTVETIYNELKGPDSREMGELLRENLHRSNSLILQGVTEAMAMYGDVRDIAALEALIACSSSLEVKNLAARLLPAFCLGSERARFNYIRYAAGYEPVIPPHILAPLRRPPLTRRGKLDPALDRLRIRVASILAGQFDPVGAAIAYANDPAHQNSARASVAYYIGNALGNDPSRWREIWDAQSRLIVTKVPNEIEEIRVSVLQSLSDLGAEGLPDIIAAFESLGDDAESVLSQAVFDALGSMCRNSFSEAETLAKPAPEADDSAEFAAWRGRRLKSAVDLAVFAAARASRMMTAGADSARFASAAGCLGSALSYSSDFPDPDGRLAAARAAGMSVLERLLMLPDLMWEKRAAVVDALGRIGLGRAASGIANILSSPYVSAEIAGGLRLAESSVDSLVTIATGNHEARDEAREILLGLLSDPREYPSVRPGGLPVGMAHIVLWRLQRLAKTNDIVLDPDFWRVRLGWTRNPAAGQTPH